MARYLLIALGAYFFLTGVYIFLAPETFYRLTPGLSSMGPYNFHFVRDISFVFLSCGGALVYGAWARNKALTVASAMWPLMHSIFHATIWAHRGFPFDQIWLFDTFAVVIPGISAAVIAIMIKAENL